MDLTVVRAGALPMFACLASFLCIDAGAQQYPAKAIRFIVPYLPSGPTDTVARLVGHGLSDRLGKPVVVENRAGAQGNIGMEAAAKSPPDGYTIVEATGFTLALNPHVYKLPYDVQRDFAPISLLVSSCAILVVPPTLPVKSVRELLKLARTRPDELTYGSSGVGGFGHVSGVLLQMLTKTRLVHVPYKSATPALIDVVSGNITFLFNNLLTTVPFVQSGKVRALAVSCAARSRVVPDVPTMAEAGVPGYESTTWMGLLAPAGTPPEIIGILTREVAAILNSQPVRERIESGGATITPSSAEDMAAKIAAETHRMAELVRFAGMKSH